MLFSAILSLYAWKIAKKMGAKVALMLFNVITFASALLIISKYYAGAIFLLLGLNGTDIGPHFSIESAILAKYGNNARNFADYTFFSSLGIIVGNYLGGLDLYILPLILIVSNFIVYAYLDNVKIKVISKVHEKSIKRLSGLFAIDAFGGGFVAQTLLAGLFVYHFHASLANTGLLLSLANIATLFSYHIAYFISKKLKIVRTMVFTHLASNALLVLVGFAPSFALASIAYIARSLLAEMDVPLRSVLVFKLVNKEERAAASSYTSGVRLISQSSSPWIAGIIGYLGFIYPLALAGLIKSTYDLLLYKFYKTAA